MIKTLLAVGMCCTALTSGATKLVHVYTMDGNLTDFVSNVSLLDAGGSVVDGRYTFEAGQGLSVTSSEFGSDTYSVELLFTIDEFTQTYTKIVDMGDLLLDSGLYVRAGQMMFYPVFSFGTADVLAGEEIHLVMTRDTDEFVRVYVNGEFQFVIQQDDSAVATDTLHFFKDDGLTQTEQSPGSVDRIRIYDQSLTPVQVRALASGQDLLIEQDLVSPGDGRVTVDLSTNTEWLDVTETVEMSVDDINADVNGWLSAGFTVADRAEFNALWHVAGLTAFNQASEDNLSVIQNFIDLFGCTQFCDFGSPRSVGMYRKFSGTLGSVVGLGAARVDGSTSPVTAFVDNCCTVPLDIGNDSWGVHIMRDVVIADTDGDGVNDQIDNCINQANVDQRDSDGDGFGNFCDGDINNDGVVNFLDISEWAPFFNTNANGPSDLNGDGQTNFLDYVLLTGQYLQAPGPSAYHP